MKDGKKPSIKPERVQLHSLFFVRPSSLKVILHFVARTFLPRETPSHPCDLGPIARRVINKGCNGVYKRNLMPLAEVFSRELM